jgi:periplasmic divalent cation tolerance protein
MKTTDLTMLYCPFPTPESAREAAHALLAQSAVACCNILPAAESIYPWQGAITTTTETILLAKTTPDCADKARHIVAGCHPYECPAILTFPLQSNPEYALWVAGHVRAEPVVKQQD